MYISEDNTERLILIDKDFCEKDNLEDISIYWSNAKEYHSADEFNGDVTLTTVLFNQNGDIILLCDAVWDIESGLGIKIHPQYEIGPQDLFL